MKNFIKNHKLLLIGIAIYILVYFFYQLYNPWIDYSQIDSLTKIHQMNSAGLPSDTYRDNRIEYASGGFLSAYFSDILPDNKIASVIPINFFFFGIENIALAINRDSVMVSMALIALLAYIVQLKNFIFKKFNLFENKTIAEKWTINYIYDNIVFYLAGFPAQIILLLKEPVGNTLKNLSSLSPLLLILFLIGIAIYIIVVLLPGIAGNIFYFLYILLLNAIIDLVNYIDADLLVKAFDKNSIPHHIIAFVIGVLIIFVANIVLENLLELLHHLTTKPLRWLIENIAKSIQKRKERRN